MSSLKRFLHLEGQRKGRAPSPPAKVGPSRFSALENDRAPGGPGEAPAPAGTVERFERQVSDQPLATDARSLDEQPFIRCMHCHGDNGRFAQYCINCSEALNTPAQQEFNRHLWDERLQQRAEENKFSQAKATADRQAMAEQLAERELLGQRLKESFEEERVDQDVALGVRMLRAIQSPGWRLAIIGGGLLVIAGFGVAALRGNMNARLVLLGCAVLGLFLFTPPRVWLERRRRRWWQDDDF